MDKKIPKIARGGAFIVSLIMFHYFLTNDVFRDDNPFIVPDVSFAVLLFLSSLLPWRFALPALMFSFSMAAGVITVSFFNHLVDGEFDIANLALLIGLVTVAALLGGTIATKKTR
jgi:hypothetical protein